MTFSATIPASQAAAANLRLEEEGIGNFRVPLRTGTSEATHAGFHDWGNDPAFVSAVEALKPDFPDLRTFPSETDTNVDHMSFGQHVANEALEWSDPTDWFDNPVMQGDTRTDNGKTWESLVDYNVWKPGVSGWREVVSDGYPEWIQPTGSHDAYNTGDRVSFEGANYESTIDANVWSPTGYPAGWQVI